MDVIEYEHHTPSAALTNEKNGAQCIGYVIIYFSWSKNIPGIYQIRKTWNNGKQIETGAYMP